MICHVLHSTILTLDELDHAKYWPSGLKNMVLQFLLSSLGNVLTGS